MFSPSSSSSSKPSHNSLNKTQNKMVETELCEDLVVEIIARLPPKSILRCRCLSKSWCSRIDSSNFIRKQAIQSATKAMQNVNVKHQFHFEKEKDACRVLYNQQELDSCYGVFVGFGANNGIICLFSITITLWNPSIRRKLNVPNVPFDHNVSVGFGYDPIADDYNILGLASLRKTLYLYSTKKNAWSEIALPKAPPFDVDSLGYFVDGKMHWVMRNKSPNTNDYYTLIFDLSSQVFDTIPLHIFDTILLQNTTWKANDLRIFVSCSDSYVEKYDMDSYVETLALLDNESCWTKKRD